MKVTGERCVLGKSGKFLEKTHLARYEFALQYVHAKKVLDVGCGAGYGADLIASKASEVIGMDICEEAIDYAKQQYKRENVKFCVGDATHLNFLKDKEFDVVVSFEVIEHITAYFQYLKEIRRVLKDNGILIISTPNKKYHSSGFEKPLNPFHITEFGLDDFENLLKKHFGNVKLYGHYHQPRIKNILKKLLPQRAWEIVRETTMGDIYRTKQASRFSDKNVGNYSNLMAICKK